MCVFTADWYPAKEEAGQSVTLKLLHLIWEILSKEQGASLGSIPRSPVRFLYEANPGHQVSVERCVSTFESLNFNHIVPQFPIC